MYCTKCGAQIDDAAVVCPQCGCATQNYRPNSAYWSNRQANVSPKSRLAALLLCIFLGTLGVHRFYVGKIGTGVLWLFTLGCFGIGWLIDVILIACGSFSDSAGLLVLDWGA